MPRSETATYTSRFSSHLHFFLFFFLEANRTEPRSSSSCFSLYFFFVHGPDFLLIANETFRTYWSGTAAKEDEEKRKTKKKWKKKVCFNRPGNNQTSESSNSLITSARTNQIQYGSNFTLVLSYSTLRTFFLSILILLISFLFIFLTEMNQKLKLGLSCLLE